MGALGSGSRFCYFQRYLKKQFFVEVLWIFVSSTLDITLKKKVITKVIK